MGPVFLRPLGLQEASALTGVGVESEQKGGPESKAAVAGMADWIQKIYAIIILLNTYDICGQRNMSKRKGRGMPRR